MKTKLYLCLIILFILSACSNTQSNPLDTEQQNKLLQAVDHVDNYLDEAELTLNSATDQATIENEAEHDKVAATSTPTASHTDSNVVTEPEDYDFILIFPSNKYPETALHILGAIEQGHSDVCTIERDGADENRTQSLKGIPTMDGFDRDEWPMAMCKEGGKGASVAYISASDNRGAGSWVGHELSQYDNGERILFIVEKPTKLFPDNIPTSAEEENNTQSVQTTTESNYIVFNSCAEAKQAGAAPIYIGEPGYSKKLDRDGDGIACET